MSISSAQPVSDAMKSKLGWIFETLPAGEIEPDSIHPARNRPSVLPPFVSIWNATDWLPALSPQLRRKRGREHHGVVGQGRLDLHGHFRRIAAESTDVLLNPTKRFAFYKTTFVSA